MIHAPRLDLRWRLWVRACLDSLTLMFWQLRLHQQPRQLWRVHQWPRLISRARQLQRMLMSRLPRLLCQTPAN